MKKFLLLCGLMVAAPLAAAFGDSKTELAEQFMVLTHVDRLIEQVEAQVTQLENQIVAQVNVPEDRREAFRERVQTKVHEIVDIDRMRDDYIELFADTYTREEFEEMIRFFKSPVGQSMLEKQPETIQKALEMSQNRIDELVAEIQQIAGEFQQPAEAN